MPKQDFVIERYDPVTERSYEQQFTAEYEPGQTVLDCLNGIKWAQDGTLSFRWSCRHAICGSCAMKVNGRSMLACKTQVTDIVKRGDPIRVAPMGNQKVVKDLVVDISNFLDAFERAETWLQEIPDQDPPSREYHTAKEEFDRWSHTATCIHCGACYSDCTVVAADPKFLGPAALAKAYRFVFDSRDSQKHERLEFLSEKHGIWDCTRCFMCIEACPKDVLPMDAIMELRTEAIREGITNNHGSRHSNAFRGGVRKRGRLDEATLPILSAGVRLGAIPELIGYTPGALRLLKSRKLIMAAKRHGANREGRRQIRRIFDEVEAEKARSAVDAEAFAAERSSALMAH